MVVYVIADKNPPNDCFGPCFMVDMCVLYLFCFVLRWLSALCGVGVDCCLVLFCLVALKPALFRDKAGGSTRKRLRLRVFDQRLAQGDDSFFGGLFRLFGDGGFV